MKKLKQMLSLLLVVTALTGLMTVGASAATDDQNLEAKALSAMGLFMGYDNTGNNFGLDNTLTREQALALLIRMKGEAAAAEAWTGALPYSDVSTGNKLLPYIGYGKEKGYTVGIGNGKFGTGRTANMQEMTIFALRGLGYSDSKTVGDFDWNSVLPTAKSVGVLDSTKVIKPFTRGHAVDILTNTLASNVKGQDYDLLSNLMNNNVVSQAQYDKAVAIINSAPQEKYDLAAGTYTLKCLGNSLRVTSDKMELRNTSPAQNFTITNQDGCSYIKTADGYYVGITSLANGTQLVLGTTPYSWLIKKQSGSTYTIRPAEKPTMVVNACEEKSANGTKIIIWTHSGAPKNTLITFTAAGKAGAVTGVKLDQTTAKVTVGKTVQLTGTISPANATNQNVTWSSSAATVAKVDGNGVVTGVKAGTATITVKTVDGGKTATCKITVTAATDKLIKSAVTFRNQTGKSITELYITDSSLSSYDAEFLKESGYKSFSHNKTITRTFEFYADTKFDILLRFADGTEAEALGLSFAKGTTSPCDLTLGTKEAILARNGVTLARVSFENKANDLDAKSKALTERYNKSMTRYNVMIDECRKLKLDQDPAFVSGMNAVTAELEKMAKTIGEGIGKLTDAQIKEFTANLNDLDVFMTQMEALIKNTKPDMTVETNKAIGAYDTAVTAYNKVVDAANAQNLGENADVRTIVNQVSATITAMSAEIDRHTNSNTPFTAEQVAHCNSVTTDLKNFTAQLQALVDTAKAAASKPVDMRKTITIINNTGVTFSAINMSPNTASSYDHQVSNSNLNSGDSVTVTIDFTGKSLVWDMQIVDEGSNHIEFKGINFTNCPATGGTITLNLDGTNGTAKLSW